MVAPGKFLPGRRQGHDGPLRMTVKDLAAGQGQKAFVILGEAGCIRYVAHLHRIARQGRNPDALRPVLQDDR